MNKALHPYGWSTGAGLFIKERSGMSDSLFQLEKVGFQANGNQILQDISFTVKQREVIVFFWSFWKWKKYPFEINWYAPAFPTSGKIYRGTDLQKSILWSIEKKSLISFKTLLYSMRQFKRTCLFLPA